MAILVVCLLASMVIAIVRLSTTPVEIFGGDFQGITERQVRAWDVTSP